MRWTDHPGCLLRACLAAWAALAALPPGPLHGAEIVIVLSGEEAPYVAAKDAANKALASQGHTVRVRQLQEVTKDASAAAGGKVDVFLAIGTKAATTLHQSIKAPSRLVYCMVPGPARAGLTEGAPASGVSMDVPLDAQVDLMLKAVVKTKTIGMLYRSDVPASLAVMKDMEQSKPKAVRLLSVPVDKHPSLAVAIEALLDQKPDIIWTAADASVYDTPAIRALLLASVRRKIPVFGFSIPFVKAGALLGIGIDAGGQGEQAAALALELLKAPAAPVEGAAGPPNPPASSSSQPAAPHRVDPPKFRMAVNLVVAQQLSLALPTDLVESASVVFRPDEEKP